MPTYELYVRFEGSGTVSIDAKNEQEAEEILSNIDYDQLDDYDVDGLRLLDIVKTSDDEEEDEDEDEGSRPDLNAELQMQLI